ncbi:MAG: hypothetical protein COA44_03665 [Arcobacter sp.]|nr:MAG: hypothetical protein COA44_03665 [Arcobacter sp.]
MSQIDLNQILTDSDLIHTIIYKAIDDGEDFIFVDLSKAVEKTESIRKEEVVGQSLTKIFPNIADFGLLEVLKRVYKTGKKEVFEPAKYKDNRIQGWRKNEISLLPNGHLVVLYQDYTQTKAMQSELQFHKQIVDHSLNEIYIFDCESLNFSYVNQGVLQNLGYTYEEMMKLTPIDIKPHFVKEDFLDLIQSLCAGSQKQLTFETIHLRKDKSTYDAELRLQLIEKDERDQIVVIGLDISERIQARKVQEENLFRLKSTERIAHFGGWQWDLKTNDLEWSDEVYRIFGEKPQSFKSSYIKFLSYLSIKDQEKVKEEISSAIQEGKKYEVEHDIILLNGETRHVREIAEFVYNQEGTAIKLIGGVLDITKYTELKHSLQEKEELYSQLFHHSPDGMMLTDKNGHILDYNQAILDILKLHSVDEFLHKQPFEFAPKYQPNGQLSSDMQAEILKNASLSKFQSFEWQLCQPDGHLTWVEILLTPIILEGQYRLHSVWRDISKRKLMQDELSNFNLELTEQVADEVKKNQKQSHQMLQQSRLAQMGEMISMIAHQWRQPLASISAIAGTLSIDVQLNEYDEIFFEENLTMIADLSIHLSSTINDFRGFFNDEKEKIPVNWKDLIESSLLIIEPTFIDTNISVEKDFPDTSSVQSYQNEVRQVILNIIKNAEDAFLENKVSQPKIWIKSYLEEDYICVSIKDNAGGVPENIIDNVFDPYFSTKLKKDGTGLGLYMSKMIIEDHCQGKLRLNNSDNGAVFTICLPLDVKEKTL